MNTIEELIQTYENKVKTINEMIKENSPNLHTGIRLKTKQSCYRTFIVELERLKNLPNELRAVNRNEAAKEFCECNLFEQMGELPVLKCCNCGKLSIEQNG